MMSTLVKAGMGVLSAGAVGGVAYSGYYHFSKDSFESKLGESVLKLTGDDNKDQWEERIKELNVTKSTIDSSLDKAIKEWDKLRDWCNNNKDNKFDKDNIKYKNFEEFCTWKLGDKLGEKKNLATVEAGDESWSVIHKKLKEKQKESLSAELQKVWDTKEEQNANKTAMHGWCIASYKKTWTGQNDPNLKEVEEYCKKS